MKKYDLGSSKGEAFATEMAVANTLAVTTANGGISAAVDEFGGQSVAVAMGKDAKAITADGGFAAVAAGFMGWAVACRQATAIAITKAETGDYGVAISRAWVRGGEGSILVCFDADGYPHAATVSQDGIRPGVWYTWDGRWRAAGESEK